MKYRVAMGKTGTDLAKDSADLILTTDDFVSIVDAIEVSLLFFSKNRFNLFF